jgi:chaperone BCS1
MEGLRETLPRGLGDAAVGIPGFAGFAQVLISKLGFDIGNLMSMYLLLFGLYQGAVFLFNQAWYYMLYVS